MIFSRNSSYSSAAAAGRNRLAPPPAEKQTAHRQASRNYGAPPQPKFLRLAAACSDPFRIYEKALRFLKLESSGQPTVKIW